MSRLVLFVETPRAGELGHRFLAPKKHLATESQIVAFFREAKQDCVVGANFIAVSREVSQQLANGQLRRGREAIVLAGFDAERTSAACRGKTVEVLGKLLKDDVPSLVRERADWSSIQQAGLVIPRPELSKWLTELPTASICAIAWSCGPRPLSGSPAELAPPTLAGKVFRAQGGVVAIALLAAVLIGFGAGICGRDFFSRPSASRFAEKSSLKNRDEPQSEWQAPPKTTPDPSISNAPPNESEPKVSEPGIDQIICALAKADAVCALTPFLSGLQKALGKTGMKPPLLSINTANAILETGKELNKKGRFDDAHRLAESCRDLIARKGDQIESLNDIRRNADVGRDGLNSEDRTLYAKLLASTAEQKREAAQAYMKSGPRKCMREEVQRWLDWSLSDNRVIVVTKIKTLTPPYTVRLASPDREMSIQVQSGRSVSESEPLAFDLSHWKDANQPLPDSWTITIERKNVRFFSANEVFKGTISLNQQELKLYNAPPSISIGVRLRWAGDEPPLPDWREKKE